MEKSSLVWMVDYLLNSAWQVPLVLLVAILAARLVARLHSAVASHLSWVAALVLATVLPACRIDVWPGTAWWHAATVAGGRVQIAFLPGAPVAAGKLSLSPSMMAVLLTLYAAVTFYFAGRIVWGLCKTEMLRRNASTLLLPEPLRLHWEALCARLGVRHAALRGSPIVVGPAVVGLRTVLLPSEFIETVTAKDLDAALVHELAHVQRSDFVKNVAYSVLMLPVAYHPCAWLLQKSVAESRETVCDAIAAEALDGRRCYARSLLRLALLIPAGLHGKATASVGIFEANTLERRVGTMMNQGKQLRGAQRLAAITGVLLLTMGTIVGMVGTHLTVRAADNPPPPGRPHVLHVSSDVMAKNLETKVLPKYPEDAKAHHDTVDGVTTLGLTVNEQGLPTNIHVVKSLRQDYDESALDAVRQWRWKPYLLNGDPIAVETSVNVMFSMGK
jgi:TonB family protein